ncbi:TIGR00153 family protein [Halochromatium roseum]|uniref:TIGR00153 family protein n=1 Tax=Halochromatium roseum TaxID=391920 RepID=UPI0019120856|nr:TIGR00153 family protein [Halochromatium roseum]MBK5939439.1 TIGR00153 family protein [Halochromatium roseum]
MKTTNAISAVFARSPFKPMQQHMATVHACVSFIPTLFDQLIAGDQNGLIKTQEAIFAKEREADEIKHNVRAHLPRSLFLPVDRRDLLEVLEVQDAIADTAQDIAGLLLQRQMTVPDAMQEHLKQLIRRCVDACTQSHAIIDELDELIETGFRGPEAERVEGMVAELNRIETETDDLAIALARKLFEHEDEMSPISVVFWYRLIEWIGNLADNAEKVGDRMLLLIAR